MLTSMITSNITNLTGQFIAIGDMLMRAQHLSEADRLYIYAYIDSLPKRQTILSATTKTETPSTTAA